MQLDKRKKVEKKKFERHGTITIYRCACVRLIVSMALTFDLSLNPAFDTEVP